MEKHYNMPTILYSSHASVAQSALASAQAEYIYVSSTASYELKRCLENIKGEMVELNSLKNIVANSWLLLDSFDIVKIEEIDVVSLLKFAQKNKMRVLLSDHAFPLRLDLNVFDFDLVVGSLEASFGLPGGFCAGARCLVEN